MHYSLRLIWVLCVPKTNKIESLYPMAWRGMTQACPVQILCSKDLAFCLTPTFIEGPQLRCFCLPSYLRRGVLSCER